MAALREITNHLGDKFTHDIFDDGDGLRQRRAHVPEPVHHLGDCRQHESEAQPAA